MTVIAAGFLGNSVAADLALLSLAITLGLALGAVRFRGMRLGISGVLFVAVLFGQLHFTIEVTRLQFLRDFALIIFIYALGLQVGPGFIDSLRAEGLRLNAMAVLVLAMGAIMTFSIVHLAGLKHESAPGIYSGAFTTTPGLAAGQDALRQRRLDPKIAEDAITTASLAYSVSYPFGVVGPILVIVILRRLFRVNMDDERRKLAAAEEARRPPIEAVDFEVTDPSVASKLLRDLPLARKHGVIFTRLLRDNVMVVPTADTEVHLGDVYRAVGNRNGLAELVSTMGRAARVDMGHVPGDVERMDLVVTRTQVLHRPLSELDLRRRYGVTLARITRAGIDLIPHASLRLSFADRVTVVGSQASIKQVADELGNCPDILNRPQLVPIFLGIVLGVLVGNIRLPIPWLHTSLRIGLAGGPLLAAIILSQWGNVGSVVWYMPVAANALFRDFGLAVFLACVGLEAGVGLWQHVVYGGGLSYVIFASSVTVVPVFVVACVARLVFKMNFITLSGWVSGAMTSSPALAFANDLAGSDSPAVSYAAVAPLATLVPIIGAQLLAFGH